MRTFDLEYHDALAALAVDKPALPDPAESQPTNAPAFDNWKLIVDKAGLHWALIDKQGTSTNTLSEDVFMEFNLLLDYVKSAQPKGLVIRSLKKGGFIAGAEISEFRNVTDEMTIKRKIDAGLAVLNKLDQFPAPTVAVLHGYCLGGGLELALACRYRIARPDTKFGFPEVMLGLHPGLAGTWRSLSVMEPVNAMTAMLTGKTLIARKAKSQGLIDAVTEERHMAAAIEAAISGKLPKRDATGLKASAMNLAPVRNFIADKMERQTAAKVRPDHYPAPFAIIKLWREHGDDGHAMQPAETDSFAKLLLGETSRNLVRTFFLREKLKRYAGGAAHAIHHVHVIGAGIMGGDIAALCALRGFSVTLQDRELKYVAPAIKRANDLFARRLYTAGERTLANDRLLPDISGNGIARADLIIEAVPESLDIKRAVYADCEARMKPDTILATNTSSISLQTLRQGLEQPQHFCGIHFFNPVAQMPLVEIVTHDKLDPSIADRAAAFVNGLDKLPLPVKSAPGFLVNRVLTPYMMEAFLAYSEGIKPEVIDRVAEQFGMPMGPIELADQVGLDVGLHVAKVLKGELPAHLLPDIPAWFEKLVADGHLGKKTGQGIYRWSDGKPVKSDAGGVPDKTLQDRLVLSLLNAVADCLEAGIVEDADAADAGMIFGAGFAPFRGGPINYARTRGIESIVQRLQEFEAVYGPRFKPSKGWKRLAG